MKRAFSFAVVVLAALVTFLPVTGEKNRTLDDLLLPYQNVIDRVNHELGSTIYIPEDNKEKVYQNVKDIPLPEFEAMIREEYLDSLSTAEPKEPDTSRARAPIPRDNSERSSVKGKESHTQGQPEFVPPLPNAAGNPNVVPLR